MKHELYNDIVDFIQESNAISLEEASTSRLARRIMDDSTFAIISPCRPNVDNKERMRELKRDVRSLGLGFNEFIGRWVEDGESFDEESLLIPNINFKQAYKLSDKYEQSSFIFKDNNGCKEVCTREFESYRPGDVVRVFNIDKNKPLDINTAKEIFAGRKSGPASLLKKGSNRKAFKFNESFELVEKQLLNTRLGFTETKITLDK